MILFLLLAVLWVCSVCPTIHWLDSSELVLSANQLGISHPPGQAPFGVVSLLFQLIPFGSVPFRTTLLSIAASLALVLFLDRELKRVVPNLHSWKRSGCLLAIALSSFSTLQTLRPEVYALSAFLTVSAVLLSFEEDFRKNALGWFLWGISLANHPTIAFAAVPFLLFARAGRGFPFAFLGLGTLLYLPIRASVGTAWNFGNPNSWDRFLWFVQGKLYRYYDQIRIEQVLDNLVVLGRLLWGELTPIGILLALVGLLWLFRRSYRGIWTAVASSLFCLFPLLLRADYYPTNPDSRGYLLPLAWGVAVLAVLGLPQIESMFSNRKMGVAVVSLLLGSWVGLQTMRFSSEGHFAMDWSAHRHMIRLSQEVPSGGTVHTGSFFTYSMLRYSQLVEGVRPDLQLTYRGLSSPYLGGTGKLESRTEIWEPVLGAYGKNQFSLQKTDLAKVADFRSIGWFFVIGGEPRTAWRERLKKDTEAIQADMGRGRSWRKEPLILNYVLHSLVAGYQGNKSQVKMIRDDIKELFPTFSEYDFLSDKL